MPEPSSARPRAVLASIDTADDAAFIALYDLAVVLESDHGARVIGGHMISLIAAAFPADVRRIIARRTGDADGGIPIQLAAAGDVHERLIGLGYEAEDGNRYLRPDHPGPVKPTIDLLVPSPDSRFRREVQGGRAFDAMPGLRLATQSGIKVDTVLVLSTGEQLHGTVHVPTVESATVLKAYAWNNRQAVTNKDIVDISNLLTIYDEHGREKVGGWRLDESRLTGSRKDAAALLHRLADTLDSGRQVQGIDPRWVVALVREHVARPDG